MTENRFDEAICWLNEAIEYGEERHNAPYEEAIQALEELQAYRAIGTIEEFKALKEKSEPKKPIVRGLGQRYCPICKCGGADHFYCTRCGQKLG